MAPIGDVQADDGVLRPAGLNPETSGDDWDRTERPFLPRCGVDPFGRGEGSGQPLQPVQPAPECVDQDRTSVCEHARFGGHGVLAAAPSRRQQDRLEEFEIGEPPDLQGRCCSSPHACRSPSSRSGREREGRRGCTAARRDRCRARRRGRGEARVRRGRTRRARRLRRPARPPVLERGDDLAAGQPRVPVWTSEGGRVTEQSEEPGLPWIAQVESEGLTGVEAVRPQPAVGRHLVVGLMRTRASGADRHGRDDGRVARAARGRRRRPP